MTQRDEEITIDGEPIVDQNEETEPTVGIGWAILFGVLFWLAFCGLLYTPWLRFWNRFGELQTVLGSPEATEQVAIIVAGVIAIWLAATIVDVFRDRA